VQASLSLQKAMELIMKIDFHEKMMINLRIFVNRHIVWSFFAQEEDAYRSTRQGQCRRIPTETAVGDNGIYFSYDLFPDLSEHRMITYKVFLLAYNA
jgi:hypothetical protein